MTRRLGASPSGRVLGQGQTSAHDAQQRLRGAALACAPAAVLRSEQRTVPLGAHGLGADEHRVGLSAQPAHERLVRGTCERPDPPRDRHRPVDAHQGDEHLALMRGETGADPALHRSDQLAALDRRLGAQRPGDEVPRLGLERDLTVLPRTAADLHRSLEQRELVGPRGETALAAKLVTLA